MATVSFHLKDPKADKATAIFIWLNGDGQRVRIYTGEKIHPSQWDKAEQKAKTRGKGIESEANITLNSSLAHMGKLLKTFYAEQRALGILPSPESLRLAVEPKPEHQENRPQPLPDFDAFIQRLALTYRPATVRNIRTTYNHVVQYEQRMRRALTYDDLTAVFHDGFTRYLLEIVKQTDNSIAKQISNLKQFLSDAVDRGRTDKQDFKKWSWSKRAPDVLALTRLELQVLETIDLSATPVLDNARGLFLISCYTGLRFSDVAALKPEHDQGDRLVLVTAKTRSKLLIPIHPKARPLLNRLWAGELQPVYNEWLNKCLKQIAKLAGLTTPTEHISFRGGQRISVTVPKWQLISSHMGRRTFITLALEAGLPWDVVMATSSHKTMASFQKYIQTTEKRQLSEFGRIWAAEESTPDMRVA